LEKRKAKNCKGSSLCVTSTNQQSKANFLILTECVSKPGCIAPFGKQPIYDILGSCIILNRIQNHWGCYSLAETSALTEQDGIMLANLSRKQPFLFNILKHGFLPLTFYVLMFCVLTYPLILKFFTHFFADTGDGLQNVWNIWWINSATLRPNLYPTIWYTNLLHWPFGTSLLGQTLNPFNGYMGIFLLRFLGLTTTYNTITIFAFAAGGLTMYWLCYYLVQSFWASILAGFLFTFSSFHFMHAQGHLQLVSLEWIPLFILCWYILITKPDAAIGAAAAISLWLVMLCDYYYFFYCVLAAILILIWYMVASRSVWFFIKRNYIASLATFTVVALLLIGPVVSSLIISNHRDPFIGFHDPLEFSLDLFALLIPGGHWLFNRWTEFYWSKLPGNINESSVYLTIPTFMLLVYVWVKRKSLQVADRHQVYLWSAIMGFFFLLALGPALHVAGKVVWDKAMPYTLLVKILPFLSLSGVPVRMVIMIILGAAVLSAMGFRELLQQIPQNRILIFVLLAILVLETLPTPLPSTRLELPGYVEALKNLPDDGGVIDQVTKSDSLSLYYQTIHGKPVVRGFVSRLPTSVWNKEQKLFEAIDTRDYAKLWGTYHIRYIITNDEITVGDNQPFITAKKVYHKGDTSIYRIGCTCEVQN
jgi:hypothetical protein